MWSAIVIMSELGMLEIWLFLACYFIFGILGANPGAVGGIFNYSCLTENAQLTHQYKLGEDESNGIDQFSSY